MSGGVGVLAWALGIIWSDAFMVFLFAGAGAFILAVAVAWRDEHRRAEAVSARLDRLAEFDVSVTLNSGIFLVGRTGPGSLGWVVIPYLSINNAAELGVALGLTLSISPNRAVGRCVFSFAIGINEAADAAKIKGIHPHPAQWSQERLPREMTLGARSNRSGFAVFEIEAATRKVLGLLNIDLPSLAMANFTVVLRNRLAPDSPPVHVPLLRPSTPWNYVSLPAEEASSL